MASPDPNRPTSDEVTVALDRILASKLFTEAPRLRALLTFIVNEASSKPGAPLDSYDVGVKALGLPKGFDPAVDPTVRVEIARLRRALARYYVEEGSGEPVRIELPRGSYVPRFRIASLC
jgi:hypothetical protein